MPQTLVYQEPGSYKPEHADLTDTAGWKFLMLNSAFTPALIPPSDVLTNSDAMKARSFNVTPFSTTGSGEKDLRSVTLDEGPFANGQPYIWQLNGSTTSGTAGTTVIFKLYMNTNLAITLPTANLGLTAGVESPFFVRVTVQRISNTTAGVTVEYAINTPTSAQQSMKFFVQASLDFDAGFDMKWTSNVSVADAIATAISSFSTQAM